MCDVGGAWGAWGAHACRKLFHVAIPNTMYAAPRPIPAAAMMLPADAAARSPPIRVIAPAPKPAPPRDVDVAESSADSSLELRRSARSISVAASMHDAGR